jgi:hypothetical protein
MEPTIKGGATLVNPQRTSRAGERRSDQFRDCFSSEAHTRGRSSRSNARPFSKTSDCGYGSKHRLMTAAVISGMGAHRNSPVWPQAAAP